MQNAFSFTVRLVGLAGCAATAMAGVIVVNGDFEQDAGLYTAPPGYSRNGDPRFNNPNFPGFNENWNPENIPGWQGDGWQGINPSPLGVAPFNDNGNHSTTVAFLQVATHLPTYPDHSSINQLVSGFQAGASYLLDFDFNSRNCCQQSAPGMQVFLNDAKIADYNYILPGVSEIDLVGPPDTVYLNPVTHWYHIQLPFTASAGSLDLKISAFLSQGSDGTLLLDNISITPVPEPEQYVAAFSVVLLVSGLWLRRRKTPGGIPE